MSNLRKYFQSQILEIQNDTALRIYGACLAMGQVLSVFNWFEKEQAINLSKIGEPLCWPFFENCFEYRLLTPFGVKIVFLIFGFLSAIGVLLFLNRRLTATAYWWQIGINIFKTLIYIQDFRMRMNQHYMLYFVTFAFLFLPQKRNTLRYLLAFIYFGAGLLKYNAEWLSGNALYANPLWISGRWVAVSCVYVVLLETFLVFGVLSKNEWIYWCTLFQLFLFHLVSWPVVGSFYPILMYLLLAIFPLTYFLKRKVSH